MPCGDSDFMIFGPQNGSHITHMSALTVCKFWSVLYPLTVRMAAFYMWLMPAYVQAPGQLDGLPVTAVARFLPLWCDRPPVTALGAKLLGTFVPMSESYLPGTFVSGSKSAEKLKVHNSHNPASITFQDLYIIKLEGAQRVHISVKWISALPGKPLLCILMPNAEY